MTKLLTTHIALNTVNMLKFFPNKVGISDSLITKTITSRETSDFKKTLRLQLGHYFQVHEKERPSNSQVPITRGEIFLGPSVNIQGGYKFMALNSSNKIV